jgi:hypothetical protein
MTQQQKPKPYNTIPRYITEDFLDKKLTRNELILYLWLRAIADIKGFTKASIGDIRDDMFPKVDVNYVQKLLLSLRRKKYLYFENHQGRRGSFRIEFGDWLLKDKVIKSIEHRFDKSKVIGDASQEDHQEPVVDQELVVASQNLMEQKDQLIKRFSLNSDARQVRSYHNEHDNEHHIENHDTLVKNSFKGTLVRDFNPKLDSYEENECKRIALEVGEKYIEPIINVLRKDGFRRIEQAWGIFREHKAEGKRMDNPPAYFQGIINTLRKQR